MNTGLSAVIIAASLFSLAGCTSSGTTGSVATTSTDASSKIAKSQTGYTYNASGKSIRVTRSGEVYLFRGLADVFSRGIDEMADQMRGKGLYAVDSNHGSWKSYADDIVKRSSQKRGVSYPITIVGHSLGANVAIRMANYLGSKGIKVSYVAIFDPTISSKAGKNVRYIDNFYLEGNSDKLVRKANGFKGKINNINLKEEAIDHFNIEKQPKLQAKVLKRVISLTKRIKARNRILSNLSRN